jgi:glutathione synthase/RimK-type ligase-like ATP-grasp enzyme
VSIKLGIHRDYVRHPNGEEQSFSSRWTELALARGFEVRQLNSRSSSFLEAVASCDGFMWRFGYSALELRLAKRLIAALEHATTIPVYPSSQTAWHFEDKIAQYYLLTLAGIPAAGTQVLWTRAEALAYCATATFPFVVKLARGMKSQNVALVRSRGEAESIVKRMFGAGVESVRPSSSVAGRLAGRHTVAVKVLLGKRSPHSLQSGYFYAQEFLPGNEHDTRVTVIGQRAFAFRRFNRPNDFRASGSGRIDWDPAKIDLECLRLAFDVANRLRTQSLALDFVRRNGSPVILEISYTFASWAIRDCPGHWVRHGDGPRPELQWIPGSVRAEDAIFEDFTARW